ncbi:restriction endonuclease subunit S [Phosphitispora fastidiosa]|uniref:restriction endonuclease subunit S n=1 Tax=Phosphitispora fastidiosa TaxID=2837202 RepID=UPI001E655A88|nr:restriction endonuclease subunit S [Phosphitispora fastidiosa]MBU7008815.1 restriction endonuclease S subunit [Phosphitispora fastidiosa]
MVFEERRIGDLASVTTGLVVKRKQAELPEEIVTTYSMLTLKSFEQDGWLNTDELENFESSEHLDHKYLTKEGDIVIRLSHPNTAIIIDHEQEGYIIPSLFAVIRLSTNVLLPEYLSIYLNSNVMKRFYVKGAIGSAIQIIKTSMLKDAVIRFPNLERQVKIVGLCRLIAKEKKLLSELVEEKFRYYNAVINKMI